MDDNRIRITVEEGERRLIMDTFSDNNIWDWKPIFVTILSFLTFCPEVIEEIFKEE